MNCYKFISFGILIKLIFLPINRGQGKCPERTCLKKHRYGAEGWNPLTAQSTKQVTLEHECSNLPSRIDLQTRPKTGPNTGFLFPGIPSAQRDDDVNSTYGGVVYYYRSSDATMIVPKRNMNDGGFSSGKTIFTGSPVWTGPTMQSEDESETRIRVWCECDLPTPDVTSKWIPISNQSSQNFHEFEHGLGREPELVTVVVDIGQGYHCDGLGSMSALLNAGGTHYSWGGVIYGYNESHVRIWAPSKNGGALFSAQDGWGVQSNSFDVSYSGKFQIKAWSKVTNTNVKRFTVGLNDKGMEVDLPVAADVDNDLIFMTVKAIDGNNKGFSFPASGAVQNAHGSGEYGGVVYSYSANRLRYWLPPLQKPSSNGPQGYLIYINDEYGGGHFQQRSLRAEIAIHVWKGNTTCNLPAGKTLPPTTTTTTTTTTTRPVTTKQKVSNGNLGQTSNRSGYKIEGVSNDGLWSKSTVLALHIVSGVLLAILLLVVVVLIILRCKQKKSNNVVPQRRNSRINALTVEDLSEYKSSNNL